MHKQDPNKGKMPEIRVPDDYEPPPSAAPTIHIPEDLLSHASPTVTPNPLTDHHSGLRKALAHLQDVRGYLDQMMGDQKSFRSDDPRVMMLTHLSTAQGLVEGYMLGEEWSAKWREEQ